MKIKLIAVVKNTLFLLAFAAILFASGCGGGSGSETPPIDPSLDRDGRWVADIEFMSRELKRLHPNVHHSMSTSEFDSAVATMIAAVPSTTDNQIFIEMLRLISSVARERDGHLEMAYYGNTGFQIMPLKFYAFQDGVFVVQATDDYQHLLGQKLVSINHMDLDQVNWEVDRVLTSDNEHSLKVRRNLVYMTPAILYNLGITQSETSAEFQFEDVEGNQTSEMVNAISPTNYPLDASNNLPKDPDVDYLRNNEEYWYQPMPETGILYIKMNAVRENSGGTSLQSLANAISAEASARNYDKIVFDLRQNNGGNNQLIDGIINFLRDPNINQYGKLYVATDALTFSAAGNLVAEIAERTNAQFIGTSPGGSGSQYGDSQQVQLPYSRWLLFVPTRQWTFGTPSFQPLAHPVDIEIDPTGSEYFDKIDPVMDWLINN